MYHLTSEVTVVGTLEICDVPIEISADEVMGPLGSSLNAGSKDGPSGLALRGAWKGAVTPEQASSEAGGWVAGAAEAAAWPCPGGLQAGPACSAGSRLPSHWAFLLPEGVAWEPGGLWRKKRREQCRGSHVRQHTPSLLTGGSSDKCFLFPIAIS